MEILVVGVLALIVFGPNKLPEIARTIGGFLKQVRAMADDVKQEFSEGFEVEDEPEDEEVAALAGDDDSDVARLEEDKPAKPDKKKPEQSSREDGASPGDGPTEDGAHTEHPVAGAIEAEREASRRAEGA
jgi:sec-independent protein translocase protein TatB